MSASELENMRAEVLQITVNCQLSKHEFLCHVKAPKLTETFFFRGGGGYFFPRGMTLSVLLYF